MRPPMQPLFRCSCDQTGIFPAKENPADAVQFSRYRPRFARYYCSVSPVRAGVGQNLVQLAINRRSSSWAAVAAFPDSAALELT
jgi:hypothetical protein